MYRRSFPKYHGFGKRVLVESLESRTLLTCAGSNAPVLDEVDDASAAFSVRQLSCDYHGDAFEVRRSSDGATASIGFTADGDLDVTQLDSFAGAADVFVSKWFDQTGGGADLAQTDLALQPMIVSGGDVLLDEKGLPQLRFSDSVLVSNSGSISNQDLTAVFLQQADHNRSYKILFGLGHRNRTLKLYAREASINGSIGGDGSGTHFSDMRRTAQPGWRTVQQFDLNGQTVRFFREQTLVDTKTHSENERIETRFQVGTYSGFISEILLFPALNENDRLVTYTDVQAYFQTAGPQQVNSEALLAQDWQYQVDLYDWLETISLADVSLPLGQLEWDGTYADTNELANLWLTIKGGVSEFNSDIIRTQAKWFVLDDENGAGIEGSGNIRNMGPASAGAFWYAIDLPLADGGQGNPYYQHPALAMRMLSTMAVDLIMLDDLQDGSPQYWSSVDFSGGALQGYVSAYQQIQHYLDAQTQQAFAKGFTYMAWKLGQWGAHDVNGNMDTKAIAALAHISQMLPETSKMNQRAARKILFGSDTKTPETTNYELGLYRRAGYIDEGDSPETTYNGVSLYYLLEAYNTTKGQADWAFLETVVSSMIDFKLAQYFTDPDGFIEGPSGYAGRTGGSVVYDTRSVLWRDITAAALFENAQPLIRNAHHGGVHIPLTENDLVNGIQFAINWYDGKAKLNSPQLDPAPPWKENHWPSENRYRPNDGWYNTLLNLVENPTPDILYPFERPEHFNKNFDEEFWAYKNNDDIRDFGFFVETLRDPGQYKGWYGGSLQTFWTSNTGTVILARHNKSGGNPQEKENTRVWSEIDQWATHHVWGRDETGKAFSTAATDHIQHPVNYLNANTVSVQTTLGVDINRGQQTGHELQGSVKVTNQFQAVENGLKITHTINGQGEDQVYELWATLPVFLRDTDQDMADTTIEYWNGSHWKMLSTQLVNTEQLRLTRDFGHGPKSVYVNFFQTQKIKLSSQVWVQSYQANTRIRNVHIDLRGNAQTIPQAKSLTYTLSTKSSGYVSIQPQDPVQPEGNSGIKNFQFQVVRTGDNTQTATVDYAITGIGTQAASANDFVGNTMPSGTLNFAAGQNRHTIVVQVNGDLDAEPTEQFAVTINNYTGSADIHIPTANATIINDDSKIHGNIEAGAHITVSNTNTGTSYFATANALGNFSISVPNGNYTLTAQHQDWEHPAIACDVAVNQNLVYVNLSSKATALPDIDVANSEIQTPIESFLSATASTASISFVGSLAITDNDSDNFYETLEFGEATINSVFPNLDDVSNYTVRISALTVDPSSSTAGLNNDDSYAFSPTTYQNGFSLTKDGTVIAGTLEVNSLILDVSSGTINSLLAINVTDISVTSGNYDGQSPILDALLGVLGEKGATNLTLQIAGQTLEAAVKNGPSGASSFSGSFSSKWPNDGWHTELAVDLNGDGQQDHIGKFANRWLIDFTFDSFVTLRAIPEWNEHDIRQIVKGDFNGDGITDVAGCAADGVWWVTTATPLGLNSRPWGRWPKTVMQHDLSLTNLNREQRDELVVGANDHDVLGVTAHNSKSLNNTLNSWNRTPYWNNVLVGDVDGNGMADLVWRSASNGDWWVGRSLGDQFQMERWANWGIHMPWTVIAMVDSNDDGKLDLVGRAGTTNNWWVAQSTGHGFLNRPLNDADSANVALITISDEIDSNLVRTNRTKSNTLQ